MEYGFKYDETIGRMLTGMDILGGTIYVTFPIDNPASVVGEPLYIGKYNREDESWERFDTMGTFDTAETEYIDTWYAIEREDTSMACPQDIELYRNENTRTDSGRL